MNVYEVTALLLAAIISSEVCSLALLAYFVGKFAVKFLLRASMEV